MIVKTEAIVLKRMNYRETSRIARLYTRNYGKISVIAKGARTYKSRLGHALQPMNLVAAVIYKKENREIQLLTQCDIVRSFRNLSEDMQKMSTAMTVLELLDGVLHAEERNERLFDTVVSALEAVNDATKNEVNALYFTEMKLSEAFGFSPNYHSCLECSRGFDESLAAGGGLNIDFGRGGVYCASCSGKRYAEGKISAAGVRVLQRLQNSTDVKSVMNITMLPPLQEEVGRVLRQYLRYHFEGLRTLKTEEVFSGML